MDRLHFEKCTLDSLETLQQLSLSTFVDAFGDQNEQEDMDAYCKVAFSLKKMGEELLNKNSLFYFVNVGKTAIGYFKVNVESAQNEPIDGGFEIERIYLMSAYQGLGFGELMFNKIFELAKQLKKRHLWLGVWEKNGGAIRFYERYGFRPFSKHDFMLGKDLQTDLLMELVVEDNVK